MESIRKWFNRIVLKIIKITLSHARKFRGNLIKAMILAEEDTPPPESIRWLLQIHDFIGSFIDRQCVRWGNGVHIKHELMTGIHSFFYERVPAGSRVLDVGCGIGAVAHAIVANADCVVIGLDMNERNIRFARERFTHPRLEFRLADATRDLPDEHFDVVVLSSVLEHIKDRAELLKNLTMRFNPGKFLIRVPTFERHYFAALKKELGLFPYTDPAHELEYSEKTFRREMGDAGLAIRHMEIRWGDIWAECVPLS